MRKTIVIAVILLILGAYFIKTYNNLDLKKPDDLQSFVKIYFGWIFNLGENVKDVTGYAAKKEWLPQTNQSNSSSE